MRGRRGSRREAAALRRGLGRRRRRGRLSPLVPDYRGPCGRTRDGRSVRPCQGRPCRGRRSRSRSRRGRRCRGRNPGPPPCACEAFWIAEKTSLISTPCAFAISSSRSPAASFLARSAGASLSAVAAASSTAARASSCLVRAASTAAPCAFVSAPSATAWSSRALAAATAASRTSSGALPASVAAFCAVCTAANVSFSAVVVAMSKKPRPPPNPAETRTRDAAAGARESWSLWCRSPWFRCRAGARLRRCSLQQRRRHLRALRRRAPPPDPGCVSSFPQSCHGIPLTSCATFIAVVSQFRRSFLRIPCRALSATEPRTIRRVQRESVLGLIGAGNMASAMVDGWVRADPERALPDLVSDRGSGRAARLGGAARRLARRLEPRARRARETS